MMDLTNYPSLARLVSVSNTHNTSIGSTQQGTKGIKAKKHRPYQIRLLDWSRTFKWMLDMDKISELDEETKLKLKAILEETVLPYLEKLKANE